MTLNQHIAAIEAWIGVPLAHQYRALLASHGGQFVGELVRFYTADEIIERNDCYEVQLYCPGYLAIGDDSGGRAVVISLQLSSPVVFVVDHGSMTPDDFDFVAESLLDWVSKGCPL
ncbi:SUKH superfamily protein [Pseudomonas duriflava]|uniref:SUKH superfamily protein n=1 Tax=Pseudomonas duriflava TaxID=459528 RepID=A0A562PKD5_9PSED|nr:SMI1/KNR4 family protein [Pseudomonas duriflava]TWI44670.1 SUKH superfamily protein [Pseudomonas duriflava]